jgi:hypothetical protein
MINDNVRSRPSHALAKPSSYRQQLYKYATTSVRIRRVYMFLGLPDPDPLVRGLDPDPDPSIMQK